MYAGTDVTRRGCAGSGRRKQEHLRQATVGGLRLGYRNSPVLCRRGKSCVAEARQTRAGKHARSARVTEQPNGRVPWWSSCPRKKKKNDAASVAGDNHGSIWAAKEGSSSAVMRKGRQVQDVLISVGNTGTEQGTRRRPCKRQRHLLRN